MNNIYKTIENDEEYLRQTSKVVQKDDPNLKKDIEKLKSFCKKDEQLIALASVQIGIPKRLIYFKKTKLKDFYKEGIDESKIMINPEIISEKGETYYWETCASCMNMMGLVKRPYSIRIKYMNENFEEKKETLTGFEATVFSHEYDHLFGVLHIDISEKIIDMPWDERMIFRKKRENKYKIVSKTKMYIHPMEEKRK